MSAALAEGSIRSPASKSRHRARLGALVMGADYRGLGIVRSLGRRGIPVWVLKADGHLLGAFSRYAQRCINGPSSMGPEAVRLLTCLCQQYDLKGWTLWPTDDESVGLVARHYQELAACYRLTIPPWKTLQWACDKRLLMELAQQAAIERPWTFCPSSREEVADLKCDFPVILKPAMREDFNRFTRDKAWRVESPGELMKAYDEACSCLPTELVMLQELIPGGGEAQFSYAAVCDQGHPLAWLCARRTRQYPMDFGRASTFVETVEAPELIAPSARLLSLLNFTGLIEIEFKRDSRDGQFKLLDVNPRVWGWHSLGRSAGVDFPFLLWRLLNGEAIAPQQRIPEVRWLRFSTDFKVAMGEILAGRLKVVDYVRGFRRPLERAIFAVDDPLPGLLEFPLLLYLLAKRFLARLVT